ncbi:MAG TPA: rhodanese-like domain-containing protein [Edaphocola sp.]|nr:rhodanese-like domain-containing protein [Edaphocola sp.]
MKYKIISLFVFIICLGFTNRIIAQTLNVEKFVKELSLSKDAKLVDVRTPEEFANGHLPNALNIDWRNDVFELKASQLLNKEMPIYVYCLSGSRSASAAKSLRANGFRNVIELKGGILAYRSAGLPEVTETSSKSGMSIDDYNALLKSAPMVLIDFYAPWCVPCLKMEPFLNKMGKDKKSKVKVIRINIDEHTELAKILKIDALPMLKLYKLEKEVWNNLGFINEQNLKNAINNLK